MLFMVIERFKDNDPDRVGKRFAEKGRMLPPDVLYHVSWVDPQNSRCFQVMSAPDRESLQPWVVCWEDLVEFEIIPVQTSADFWAAVSSK